MKALPGRRAGTLARSKLCIALSAVFCSSIAPAAPRGGQVTSGQAAIVNEGSVTRIDQSSQKAAINWQGFGIGAGETVNFNQPNAAALTLNRVVGNEKSVIDGALNANGKVFLINSNGVLFSKGSRVNTGGLVASTLTLDDADLNAGRFVFKSEGSGAAVINQGALNATEGGYVALLGKSVSNQGVIVATQGTVALASGRRISLDFGGDALLRVSIDEGALAALVENKGAVFADGGTVLLSAKAADELIGSQVNNSGIVQARTLADLKGEIHVDAIGGTAAIAGKLDASAPVSGDGGRIETSGRKVGIADSAVITSHAARGETGSWTVDPHGFKVGPGGDIGGGALGTQLGLNNVVLSSTHGSGSGGGIQVNEAVTWSANTALTLNATKDIDINAAIVATGAHAGLTMNYGGYAATGSARAGSDYHINNIATNGDGSLTIGDADVTLSGANAALTINGTSYTLIHSMAQLAAISPAVRDAQGHPMLSPDTGLLEFLPATGQYALAQDLDAAGTTYSHAVIDTLLGSLAGLGHAISNLKISTTTINEAFQFQDAALIGTLGTDTSSQLRDIGLVHVAIDGGAGAAGLVEINNGRISNVYVTGAISGVQPVGGVVGFNLGSLDNAHADVSVSALAGGTSVGGLAGFNGLDATITNATVKGSVTAAGLSLDDGGLQSSSNIGGLVGLNGGTIDNAHTFVTLKTTNSLIVGGLVGENLNVFGDSSHGVISNSSASGSMDVTWTNTQVNGQSYGGLVGDNNGGFISRSTASVNMTATATTLDANGIPWSINGVGGLVGTNATSSGVGGSINDSSSSGSVTGSGATYQIGGAVGANADGALDGVRATGNVTTGASGQDVGALVGSNGGTVQNSGATGSISAPANAGGDPLFGINTGTVANSNYHDAAAEAAAAQAAAEAAAAAAAQAAAAAAAQAAAEAAAAAAAQAAAAQAAAAAAAQAAAEAAAAQAAAAAAAAAAQAAAEAAAAQAAAAAAQAAAAAAAQAAIEAAAAQAAAAAAARAAATLHDRADAAVALAATGMTDAQRSLANPHPQATVDASGLARRPASIDSNIVITDRNFQANVRSIEVNGQVFQIDDDKPGTLPPSSGPSPSPPASR